MTRMVSSVGCSLLLLVAVLLLGCPHVIYAIPTLANSPPEFSGPEPVEGAKFVPIELDLRTKGRFLLFRLRVDGRSLEPSAGSCRKWFLRRGAREAQTTRRIFCDQDAVRFYLAAGVRHTLELLIGSEHAVAKRALLRPGEHLHWRMPTTTRRVELVIDPKAGSSYTVRGGETTLNLRRALPETTPRGTRWDSGAGEPIYHKGVEVGSMRFQVVRDGDRRVLSDLSVPLYSGPMTCELPFCETE